MPTEIEAWVDPKSILVALVYFHPSFESGIKGPLRTDMRCPCFPDNKSGTGGFTAVFGFEGDVWPGEQTKAVLQFVMGREAVETVSRSDVFYLGHLGYVGWARILQGEPIPRLRKGWARPPV